MLKLQMTQQQLYVHIVATTTPHSTGYTHSLNHHTDNILTLYFNGKILKRVTLVRTNMSSLKMVHMD
jgi:hypothetical protein